MSSIDDSRNGFSCSASDRQAAYTHAAPNERELEMSTDDGRVDELDEYAARLIRWKAKELVRRSDFRNWELEDIQQDLWFDLLRRAEGFNVERGTWKTYVNVIVNHQAASMVAARQAGKRKPPGPIVYLDEEVTDADGGPVLRSEKLLAEDFLILPHVLEDQRDLRIDMGRVYDRLPPDQQQMLDWLTTANISDISRATGRLRSSLHNLKRQLLRRFEDDRLRDYT